MKVVFAAGGTGGHINPALAAAGCLKSRNPDAEILFIGTEEHMESRLVPQAGFEFKTIHIAGFQRKLSVKNVIKNIRTLGLVLKSTSETKKILREFCPDAVIGFGGYVSGPVVRTAHKMGIKTAIHEQNAFPGVTNKALAKDVDRVMLTVEQAEKYLAPKNEPIITGLPVRREIFDADRDFARAKLGVGESQIMILSMGGSLGAKTINENMVEVITELCSDKRLVFMHSTGKYGTWVPAKLRENGVKTGVGTNVTVREYIDDMDICLAASDLVISRAGASSLSEIEAVGRASILIPSPNVAENHQYHNAMTLVDNDAARVIEEKDLHDGRLLETVKELAYNPEMLRRFGENAKKIAVMNSAEKICEVIEDLIG
ncbi:MAG: undecaprenyldiphospho-muramoylpentapeptide beta-N-acetylglucosaminyltransferase [Ruminococcaceae bacterium]|nr:undecaprenyldiphospho-muramoylpentapeptide beta-N-acetylglucosaminyltransferase [Oscillospiraceae bacterium]